MLEDYFKQLESVGIIIPPDKQEKIQQKLDKRLNYHAKIGVFGKTGAGKSSLCNALFGSKICEISDIESCTREPKEVLLKLSSQGLTLVDVPGVGETSERDEEYAKLYNSLLPELDLVLWVLKADDRAYLSDLKFYNDLVKKYTSEGKPFIMVLNQVDKVEPIRSWDVERHQPGESQLINITEKVKSVSNVFDIPESKILTISASENYNLFYLVEEIVYLLPNEQSITVLKNLDDSFKNQETAFLAQDIVSDMLSEEVAENSDKTLENKAVQLVEKLTNYAINGFPSVGISSAKELAEEYRRSYRNLDDQVGALIRWETSKNAMVGFLTGVGGLITLPIALPADFAASWIYQARMSAAIAYLNGHDINEDRVKTFIIAVICGDSVKDILKNIGIKVAQGFGKQIIKRIPAEILRKINRMVGMKLLAKSGQKALIKLVKLIPVLGGVVGAAFDASYCHIAGKRAQKVFKSIDFN